MTVMSCEKYQRKVTYSTRITKSGVYHSETGLITWTITVTNPDFHEYSAVSLTSTTKNDLILFDCLFYLEADICNPLRCLLDLVKNKNVTETSRKG